jgi:hypothetical protein
MSENPTNKYGKNRNAWRKVYGYARRQPNIVEFFDRETSTIVEKDLNQTLRHRDYFQVKDDKTVIEYDEGIIYFNNVDSVTANYNILFSSSPIVVLTMEDSGSNNQGNVNIFGLSTPNYNQLTVGTSAPFSGSVRYRAIHTTRNYPVFLENQFYTSSFWAYAGRIDTSLATDYTASFGGIPSGSLEYRATVFDAANDNSQDVALVNTYLTQNQSENTISSQLTNQIHFMVTKIGP